jgi:predicted PhzF superfamily epimerase YddE/YHI9
VHVVSTARAKTLVEVGEELDALQPDFEALWAACEAMESTGAYVFNRELSARQFPVRAGYPEDAATGVAASALAGFLAGEEPGWQEFSIAQGRAMGRPSRLFAAAHVRDGRVTATRVRGVVAVE